MNPISAKAAGYRSYQDIAIDFPSGVTAIVGANGSGKSSLIDLIPLALFGSPTRSLADYLNTECEEMSIELTFEHAGRLLRVRRQFSSRGRGKSTLDLEEANLDPPFGPIDEWLPLTRGTSAVTQSHLEDIIGLSRETYLASAHLSQGQGDAFTAAQPRDRKQILSQILGLGMWDRLLSVARDELRGCETQVAVTASQIAGCEEQVARLGDVLEMLNGLREAQAAASTRLAAAETDLEDARRAHGAAATLAETVRVCQSELAAATDAHDRAVQAFSDATRAAHELADRTVELGEATADAAHVPALEAQLDQVRAANESAVDLQRQKQRLSEDADQRALAHTRLVAQATALRSDAQTARGKADRLEAHIGEAADCDRCGQKLGAEAAGRAALSYRAEADTLDAKAADRDTACAEELGEIAAMKDRAAAIIVPSIDDPASVEQTLRAARAAAVQAATLTAQVEQLTAKAAKVDEFEAVASASVITVAEKQTALNKAQADVPDMAVLDSRVALAQAAVRDTRAIVETRQADIVRAEADLERIREAKTQLAASQATINETQARVDLLKLAERAYGRDGIPALIVENAAIPQIEAAANELLQMMPMADGTTFRVELRTQRALKTSDHLKETLDILIHAGDYIRPYETFSEGEHGRQNICLRIALSLLLAHRRGADSKLLAIDEIPYLDDLGKEQLIAVVQHVSSHFDRILMISHESALRDAFDQRIVIEKGDDGRSRIAGALETVSA